MTVRSTLPALGLTVAFTPMVVNEIQTAKLMTVDPYRLSDAAPVSSAPAWIYEKSRFLVRERSGTFLTRRG